MGTVVSKDKSQQVNILVDTHPVLYIHTLALLVSSITIITLLFLIQLPLT